MITKHPDISIYSITYFAKLAAFGFAMFTVLCIAPIAAAQSLTKEADLTGIYERQIVSFWHRHGERHDFLGVGGVRIAAMVFPHPGSNEGIVISSGYGESFIKYREVIYDLWRAGYQVYILDHRGQGLSERLVKPNEKGQADPKVVKRLHDLGYVERFEDFVTDLKTFVERNARPNNKRLFLLAHSMGGAIGSLYLETYADDFYAAALSSPMHQPDLSPVPPRACWLLRLGPPKGYAWGQRPYVESREFNADRDMTSSHVRYQILKRHELQRHPQAQLGGPSFNWAYESCMASNLSVRNAGRIKARVLLFQASNDRVVKAAGQQKFCDAMNSSHAGSCRLELMEGARHELLIEKDKYRNRVLKETIRFFTIEGR